MPAMNTRSVGFGAGTADTPNRPNVVQVVVGDLASQPTIDGEVAVELAVNVDDVTGEVLADAIEQLLAAGAFDAWITPIIMKKGRPAFTVRALCDQRDWRSFGRRWSPTLAHSVFAHQKYVAGRSNVPNKSWLLTGTVFESRWPHIA